MHLTTGSELNIGTNNLANDPSQFVITNGVLTNYIGKDENVIIPNNVKEISALAFMGRNHVVEITVPDSVTSIGRYAFVSCSALQSIIIGFGVSVIPMGCFCELPNLKSVILSDQICEIDDFAFRNCKKLSFISFLTMKYCNPVTAEEKGKVFELLISGKSAKIEYIDLLDDVPTIKKIGNYAFMGCEALDTIPIQEKTIVVGFNAFDVMKPHAEELSVADTAQDAAIPSKDYSESVYKLHIFAEEDSIDYEHFFPELADEDSQYVQEDEIDNNDEPEADEECYLVSGFSIVNGVMQNDAFLHQLNDAPIAALELSTRAYNALYRMKPQLTGNAHEEVMVSDVLKITQDDLMKIRNMGVKSAEEIIEKVKAYLNFERTDSEEVQQNILRYTIAPEYELVNSIITHVSSRKTVPDVVVDDLGLGVRATNSLRRGHVSTLSELIIQSPQQLKGFPNMGTKSVAEIMEYVPKYLDAHQTDETIEIITDPSSDDSSISIVRLPELDPEIAVVAADYAVAYGHIYSRTTYKVIQDAPINVLNLSVRSLNCLMRNGNKSIASLICMPFEEFRGIRNLGALSANEIQEKLEQYLYRKQEQSQRQAIPDKTVSSSKVLAVFHNNEFLSMDIDELLENLPNASEEDLLSTLNSLIESQQVATAEGKYFLYHQSFFAYVDSLSTSNENVLDERSVRILQMRVSGKTLEEVGQSEGATRERIRQIENKAIDRVIMRGHVIFDEDRYAYLFSTYSFEKDFYLNYLDETHRIWYYLNYRYARGKEQIELALEDKLIPFEIRRIIDRYVHRGSIRIDGIYIHIQRGEIEDVVVEKYCKEEVTLDQFFELYDQFIKEHELTDERLQVTKAMRATRSNRLSESNKLLWKQNQRLRYYDIEGGDYAELLETLNLGQYENIELSTRKFIVDYPELMERYDLRDEYEVHNLLKKIHAEKENPNIVFARMPHIQFGVFDRDAAVKEILFAMAPVNLDDLAEMISLEYGTRTDTIKANWLNEISEYYHQGIYSVDYEEMPEEHMRTLKATLKEDFYFLTELRKIYSRLVQDADLSLLSTFNLKRMGFLVGASYVIQNYPTAEAYFEHLLTEKDVVDVAPIIKRYTGLTTYSTYLASLKHEMKIIEFEPFQYINIRRLDKLGYDKIKLREYGVRVWSYLVNDDYFTVQSLRGDGFEDELETLGFGDLFYSSLLKEDGRFAWQRVGNAVVFNPKGEQFTVHDFLVECIKSRKSMDVDDFVNELTDYYGVSLERSRVIEKIKGSDIYFDPIMEKLYADYATYFEEI